MPRPKWVVFDLKTKINGKNYFVKFTSKSNSSGQHRHGHDIKFKKYTTLTLWQRYPCQLPYQYLINYLPINIFNYVTYTLTVYMLTPQLHIDNTTTCWRYLFRDRLRGLLKVHDCIRNLDVDRTDNVLRVERALQPIRNFHQLTYKVQLPMINWCFDSDGRATGSSFSP